MRGIQVRNGEMVVSNKYGEHIISCPTCKEKGIKFDGSWLCSSDDCRVVRFFTA